MEHVEFQGWTFEFNKEVTTEYYANLHYDCSCASCRNFHKNIHEMPLDVKEFLENFGIDINNPIEKKSVIAIKDENKVEHEVCYCVKGIPKSMEGYEIDIGPVQIVIYDHKNMKGIPHIKMQNPYFVFVIYNMYFPWTVDEDIDEIYPEHQIRKKFLQKILMKIFRSKRI